MDAHNKPSTPPGPQVQPNRSRVCASRRANPTRTEYFLVATIMTALGVMAVPHRQAEPAPPPIPAVTREAHLALKDFREAILHYRLDHGLFPGYGPGRLRIAVHGPASVSYLRGQLLGWSDEWGNSSYFWMSRFEYGPYLFYGMPENPENKLDTVRLVPREEAFPTTACGETGWIYKPETGELRLNSAGTVPGTDGVLWFNL